MGGKRTPWWLLTAVVLTFLLPVCALSAPFALKALLWQMGPDPAIAVLEGEHWGKITCAVLLTATPFVPVLCFILERVTLRRASWKRERAKPPEFATEEERRAFYLKELNGERKASQGMPWIAFAALCGIGVTLFSFEVLRAGLPGQIEKTGRDLELYEASVEPGQYPDHGYRTDDGRIVRRAYCYGIIHTR